MRGVAVCVALWALWALAGVAALGPSCRALRDAYRTKWGPHERSVVWRGRSVGVRVATDAGAAGVGAAGAGAAGAGAGGPAPAAAAAALLAAALSHALRYADVRTALAPDLCRLVAALDPPDGSPDYHVHEAWLVPAMVWDGAGAACARRGSGLGPARLEAGPPPAAAAAGLALWARLADATDAAEPVDTTDAAELADTAPAHRPRCWRAAVAPYYTNRTLLYDCAFLDTDDTESAATLYYAEEHAERARALAAGARPALALRALPAPSAPSAPARRQLNTLLRRPARSFFFLDYDIWADHLTVLPVEPPPGNLHWDSTETMRLADEMILRQAAPGILKSFYDFQPTAIDIREILDVEAGSADVTLDEAACAWALRNPLKIAKWFQVIEPVYELAVFLCRSDPDHREYNRMINATVSQTFARMNWDIRLVVKSYSIRCDDEFALERAMAERRRSAWAPRLAGALARGPGAGAGPAGALGAGPAVLHYDVPAPGAGVPAGASLTHLVVALTHFLSVCGWKRLALLSEDTELAAALVSSLRTTDLILHNAPIETNFVRVLQTLINIDARVIYLNMNSFAATSVLCAADFLNMTSENGYVFILREWHAPEVMCESSSETRLRHFTVSFWWRGGSAVRGFLALELQKLWPNRNWPMYAAPLADALTLLLHSFNNFLLAYPEHKYDLQSANSTRLMWSELKKSNAEGVTQTLEWEPNGSRSPLVFVDEWHGSRREPVVVWRIADGRVRVAVPPARPIFRGATPSDGAVTCWLGGGGREFCARCLEGALGAALGAALAAAGALGAARRGRRAAGERRRARLAARLAAPPALAALLHPRTALRLGPVLGKGHFGRVRLAHLDSRPVAAKALDARATPADESDFLNEAALLAELRHEHVVSLVGVCVEDGPPLLLMEFALFGDLGAYLVARRGATGAEAAHVSAAALTRLGREAAAALAYLAAERVVHRDVRASNCLVDSRRRLRLADFGLARRTRAGALVCRRRGPLPVAWSAPESLAHGEFSAASDVWALGVLLLELVSLGAPPYGEWPPPRVLAHVVAGGRPPLPAGIDPCLRRLLCECWGVAGLRPPAGGVRARLAATPPLLRPAPPCCASRPPCCAPRTPIRCARAPAPHHTAMDAHRSAD